MAMTEFLPYGRQSIDEDDIAAVTAVLRSDWLTTGPEVEAFEKDFASAVDAPYAVSCSSGTAGLHLMMCAIGAGPGDAVIVPAVTFVATANAARYVGATVYFADVDPDTGLMGPEHVAEAIDRIIDHKPRIVVPVHLAGQPSALAEISDLAGTHGMSVLEDACHAIGSRYGNRNDDSYSVGSCHHSAMVAFSTHPVKTIASGEGGVVTCRDKALYDRLSCLRNHGIVRDPAAFVQPELSRDRQGKLNPWYYEIHDLGFNYRASDIHCALGRSQLKKLAKFVDRRNTLVSLYDRCLASMAPDVRPLKRVAGNQPAWHLYSVLIDFAQLGLERAEVMSRLREAGIGTQVHYIPVPLMPAFRENHGLVGLPGARAYYARTLSLPLFPSMKDDDVDRVADALAEALDLCA